MPEVRGDGAQDREHVGLVVPDGNVALVGIEVTVEAVAGGTGRQLVVIFNALKDVTHVRRTDRHCQPLTLTNGPNTLTSKLHRRSSQQYSASRYH